MDQQTALNSATSGGPSDMDSQDYGIDDFQKECHVLKREYQFIFRLYATWQYPNWPRAAREIWSDQQIEFAFIRATVIVFHQVLQSLPRKHLANQYLQLLKDAYLEKLESRVLELRMETGQKATKEGLVNDI